MNQYSTESQQDFSLDAETAPAMPSSRELAAPNAAEILDDAQTEVVLRGAVGAAEASELLDHSTMPVVADAIDSAEALEPVKLAKQLFQCWSRQTTGALLIAREGETLTVFIESGALVLIESSIPGDVLGRTLVQNGRIEPEHYAASAQHAIETGVTLGRALVELDYLSREDLTYESAAIAREQIVGCFMAQAGSLKLHPNRSAPESDRRCMIPMGIILAEGVAKHFDAAMRTAIVPGFERRYFNLQRAAAEVIGDYALSAAQQRFLAFAGRAYNATDAADAARLSSVEAHALLALLTLCEEITDFIPGVAEFEARIREERERQLEQSRQAAAAAAVVTAPPAVVTPIVAARQSMTDTNVMRAAPPPRPSMVSVASPVVAAMPAAPVFVEPAPIPTDEMSAPDTEDSDEDKSFDESGAAGIARESTSAEVKVAPEVRMAPAPSLTPSPTPLPLPENVVPPMPVATDPAARTPEWIQFGPPTDSTRTTGELHEQSREQFQKGVALLTLGNFDAAENAFREAIALRAEAQVSPVYLVALGRAIYYNPAYTRDGKLPILLAIVTRTRQLAPNDPRVLMLANWVRHAEAGTA